MSIENKVMKFKDSLDQIEKNRQTWNNRTKNFISEILTQVVETHKLDWHVDISGIENLQSVYIAFNKSASGITEHYEGGGGKHYVKYGGALIFAQSYTGMLHIFLSFPYVEEWVNRQMDKYIRAIYPQEITKELILNYVELLLDEMIKFEESAPVSKIGFNQ